MARLDPAWVVPAAAYERVRSDYASWISRARTRRRVRLDEHCTLQFETPEFALWHVHELLRVEGRSPARVARTLDDVDAWCPGPGGLIATLMIDTDDAAAARSITADLVRGGAVSLCSSSREVVGRLVEPGLPGEPLWYLRFEMTGVEEGCACRTSWSHSPLILPSALTSALAEDLRGSSASPLLHRLVDARGRTRQARHDAVRRPELLRETPA